MEKQNGNAAISLSSVLLGAPDVNGAMLPDYMLNRLRDIPVLADGLARYSGGILTFAIKPDRALEIVVSSLAREPTRQTQEFLNRLRAPVESDAKSLSHITFRRQLYALLGKSLLNDSYQEFICCFRTQSHQTMACTLLGEYYSQYSTKD